MAQDGVEHELKLAASREFVLPDLSDLGARVRRLPDQSLRATYFDSPDHRLWRRRITLRHRTGEGDARGTWTLKLPRSSTEISLERAELEWDGALAALPSQVEDILEGILRGAPLRTLTSLQTERQRLSIESAEHQLAEVDDDLVTIHGGPRDGATFRQIEVELEGADENFLESCDTMLREAGAWVDEQPVKLAHALDLSATSEDVALSAGSSIGEVVQASIQRGLGKILDHEYLLRLGADPSSEAIHQTRVASRRLRSDLKSFGSLLDPLWVATTRAELKWVGGTLGEVRDADVLAEGLGLQRDTAEDETPGSRALRLELEAQRLRAIDDVIAMVSSERYLDLLDDLAAAATHPPFVGRGLDRKASKALKGLVKAPVKALRKQARKAGKHPSNHQLHEIRIRSKQVRYAAEASKPVVGEPAARLAEAAEALQSQLGEHHDAVVAEAWLGERAQEATAHVAFVAGRRAAEQSHRQAVHRKGWRSSWKRVERAAHEWLD
jgi:CHAD domain-containing protein